MKPEEITHSDWLRYNLYFFLEHILGYSKFQEILGASRRRFYFKIRDQLKSSQRGGSCEVEDVGRDLTPKGFLQKCFKPVLPKVFRGAAYNWDAVKKWDLDYFKDKYGDKDIIITDNQGLIDPRNQQEFQSIKLGQYIDALKKGSLTYLKFSRLIDENEELKQELDLFWLRKFKLPLSFREETYLFIGAKGTITPIHCGFTPNLFIQISGQKKWVLYEVGDRIFLDPRTERTFYYYSNADPYNLDDERFPLLKYAKRYEVTLNPGDVLWVPPFVWHQVENPTDSIGLAYRFNSVPTTMRSSKLLTLLFFLATKPSLLEHFLVTSFTKQAYIFIKRQADIGRFQGHKNQVPV